MFLARPARRTQFTTLVALLTILPIAVTWANPPPPRQPDPISLDRQSPSVMLFGNTTADLYGDNPFPPASGWDIGGPGPVLHVFAPAYGLNPILDETDGISNNEFNANVPQVIYFSVDDASLGLPGQPVRHQAIRGQAAGDRWVTNGRTSRTPAAVAVGGAAATILTPALGPRHLLSANQTRYNEIPSIPPPAFNAFVPPAGVTRMDDMDALEINPIDFNGDRIHDTFIYFSLAPGSVTLGALGRFPADILVVPPGLPAISVYAPFAAMGLGPQDNIDALAVWNLPGNNPLVADPGQDYAIFSLSPGSPYLAGPDGVFGTADDRSAADIFVTRFTGTNRLFLAANSIGLRFEDNVDALDVEPRQLPEVFDWWRQMTNIDVPFLPPPGIPPFPPANDFHVELLGIDIAQVVEVYTGGFPNASVSATANGVRIDWTGGQAAYGQIVHFGWTLADTDRVAPGVLMYWTRDGQPVYRIPDAVQRWNWETESVVDELPNYSDAPILVQRRAAILDVPIELVDLTLQGLPWQASQPIDPQPIPVLPGQSIDLPLPFQPNARTYSVMYTVQNTDGSPAGVFLNALTRTELPGDDNSGACCLLGGTACQVVAQEFCEYYSGIFHGVGTQCGPTTCSPAPCRGDMNCDGTVDFADIDPFVLALSGPDAYHAQFPNCRWENGDANGDGTVDFADIDGFVGLLFTPCP